MARVNQGVLKEQKDTTQARIDKIAADKEAKRLKDLYAARADASALKNTPGLRGGGSALGGNLISGFDTPELDPGVLGTKSKKKSILSSPTPSSVLGS